MWDDSGTYRVIYVARLRAARVRAARHPEEDPGHSKPDIEIATHRYAELRRGRQ
jgi:phage-related protein